MRKVELGGGGDNGAGERKRRGALRKKAGSINDINQQILRPPERRCAADTRAEVQPLTRCLFPLSLPGRRTPRRTDCCCPRGFIRGGLGRETRAGDACMPPATKGRAVSPSSPLAGGLTSNPAVCPGRLQLQPPSSPMSRADSEEDREHFLPRYARTHAHTTQTSGSRAQPHPELLAFTCPIVA